MVILSPFLFHFLLVSNDSWVLRLKKPNVFICHHSQKAWFCALKKNIWLELKKKRKPHATAFKDFLRKIYFLVLHFLTHLNSNQWFVKSFHWKQQSRSYIMKRIELECLIMGAPFQTITDKSLLMSCLSCTILKQFEIHLKFSSSCIVWSFTCKMPDFKINMTNERR